MNRTGGAEGEFIANWTVTPGTLKGSYDGNEVVADIGATCSDGTQLEPVSATPCTAPYGCYQSIGTYGDEAVITPDVNSTFNGMTYQTPMVQPQNLTGVNDDGWQAVWLA